MKINSILGEIDTACLDRTLIHEHITCYSTYMHQAFGAKWIDLNLLEEESVKMINDAGSNGIHTIVDCTPINLGRNIKLLKNIAERVNVNLLVATGFLDPEDSFMWDKPASQLIDLLVDESLNGIEGTSIKPAIIKCAIEQTGWTQIANMLTDVTAVLHRETNLPIFAHTDALHKKNSAEMADALEKRGIDLSRVIIGHCGDTNDIDYLEEILRRGCYIGLDRFGDGNYINSMENRTETLCKLIDRGWIKQIFVSGDMNVFLDARDCTFEAFKNQDNVNRPVTFRYLDQKVFPLVKKYGFTDKEIQTLMVDNVREYFERT